MIIIIPIIVTLILFTFFIEFLYGIFHFNYKVNTIQLIKVKQYAFLIKQLYVQYKNTGDIEYKNKIIKCFNEIEKYMDIYDVKYIYSIDLINIKKELMLPNYKPEYAIF